MRLCILVSLCLAQLLSHPVSLDTLHRIQDDLTNIEKETTISLESTLKSISELKELLGQLGISAGVEEEDSEEYQDDVLEDEPIVEETVSENEWWESDQLEDEEEREDAVITESEGLQLGGESEPVAEPKYERGSVLEQLDELIDDNAEQEQSRNVEEMVVEQAIEEKIIESKLEESDPRKIEEDAAEEYLAELGFA